MPSVGAVRAFVLLLIALGLAGCEAPLNDGVYALQTTAVLQDGCSGDLGEAIELPDVKITTSGKALVMDVAADGPFLAGFTGARGRFAFVGRFFENHDDQFIADATFDVVKEIRGVSCVVFSQAHIGALVQDENNFLGRLRISYERRPEAAPGCLPGCVLELTFTGSR